jgi:RNA polymerase sigma-70 factor (ECF subfamily)
VAAEQRLHPAPVSSPDGVLLERMRRGNERAFAELYGRHARYLAGAVYRILGNDADLDDIVQETFVDAADGPPPEPEIEVRAWLVRIAVRHARKILARRRRRRWLGLEIQRTAPAVVDPRQSEIGDLYDALDRLDPDLRIPWILSRIEGDSLEEVAKYCGVSLATVKRRIGKADERLERRLRAR